MDNTEKILNKFPKKALIGIILSLAGIIGSGSYFVYQKYIDVDYQSQIDSLKFQLLMVKNKDISQDAVIISNQIKANENDNKLKEYVNKSDRFILENADTKNKTLALQFLELKQIEPVNYEPKIYRDTVFIHSSEVRVDTVKEIIIQKDTVKKGLFKRILNK